MACLGSDISMSSSYGVSSSSSTGSGILVRLSSDPRWRWVRALRPDSRDGALDWAIPKNRSALQDGAATGGVGNLISQYEE